METSDHDNNPKDGLQGSTAYWSACFLLRVLITIYWLVAAQRLSRTMAIKKEQK